MSSFSFPSFSSVHREQFLGIFTEGMNLTVKMFSVSRGEIVTLMTLGIYCRSRSYLSTKTGGV